MSNLTQFYNKLKDANPNNRSDGLNDFIFAIQQEYLFNVSFNLYVNKGDANNTVVEQSTLVSRFFRDSSTSTAITDFQNNCINLSVRSVALPNMSVDAGGEEINNDFGKVTLPSKGSVIPDSNAFTIQFLNTQKSFCEYFIYPWILETKSNEWVYNFAPFTRADITVQFRQQNDQDTTFEYVFHGCFPIAFDTVNPSHDAESNFERGAVFSFNWMEVVHGGDALRRSADKGVNSGGLENKHIQFIGT